MNCPCAMKPNDWLPLPPNSTTGAWLDHARRRLEQFCESPSLEAQMAAAFVLEKPRAHLLAHPEESLTDSQLDRLEVFLQKLVDGYPFAYLSGQREFYGRIFEVRPGLLVPRPETEMLAEMAITWLRAHPDRRRAVDVGCGTGCIAVTLAAEVDGVFVDALDIDPLAVEVTSRNAQALAPAGRVNCQVSDLLTGVNGCYDLICANLPYIPSSTVDQLPAARHEPHLALDGGTDGLRLIEKLLDQACARVNSGGLILLEIEASQGASAPNLAQKFFPEAEVTLNVDLAGLSRLVSIQL